MFKSVQIEFCSLKIRLLKPSLSLWLSVKIEILKRWLCENEGFVWALVQYDCCPYKKEEIQTQNHTQKEDLLRIQRDDSHLQAKDKNLRRNQSCWRLDLRLLENIQKQWGKKSRASLAT